MASKCALAAQLGIKVQLGSPPWQYKSNLEPNWASKWDFLGPPGRMPRKIGVQKDNMIYT